MSGPLPVDDLRPEILARLDEGSRLILQAEPAAGKTTRIPPALLDARVAGGREILVLEPRRIAARAAATFVARERGERPGGSVGYRVRFDSRGGEHTRLWYVTEGVFTRRLAIDPFLESVGVVVLDEFHERHAATDVALSVVRELQETVRPDLRLLVMSATLETGPLAAFLGDAPVLTSTGRVHPVDVDYDESGSSLSLPARCARAIRRVVGRPGDILVFLPGIGEIRRVTRALEGLPELADVDVLWLHGGLSLESQERALRSGPRKRVILSTNVAETSLTVEGVSTVIDSGLAREARFDPRHGINALETVPISRTSADQRTGRAGRLGPGRCIRLWTPREQRDRREAGTPEILRLDLAGTVLELRAWGLTETRRLDWLDPPRPSAVEWAENLLVRLGALTPDRSSLTGTGRRLLDMGTDPRLARILVEAKRNGHPRAGAFLVALASERDVLRSSPGDRTPWPAGPSDLLLRLRLLSEASAGRREAARELDPRAARAVETSAAAFCRNLGVAPGPPEEPCDEQPLLHAVLAGYPDRVARRREPGSSRGLLVGGTGVVLSPQSVVREAELFVALDVDAGERRAHREAIVHTASAVRPEWLEAMFPDDLRTVTELRFEPGPGRVVRHTRRLYDDLLLNERWSPDVSPDEAGPVLADVARREPHRVFRFGRGAHRWLQRIRFLAHHRPELGLPPDPEDRLAETAAELAAGHSSFRDVPHPDAGDVLQGLLTASQRKAMDREAPSHVRLPSGRDVAVRYEDHGTPSITVPLQELFGWQDTIHLAGGRIRLSVEILAPNRRPVQRTDDLAGFWQRTYPEVRKELRGRYPKHDWPEDPLQATPTRAGLRRRNR